MLVELELVNGNQHRNFHGNQHRNFHTQSTKIRRFGNEKENFLQLLFVCSEKLLLPKDMLSTIKNSDGLETFYNLISGYNIMIRDARVLSNQLKKIKSWGVIFNTKNSWKNSIDTVCVGFAKYQNEIINFINEESNYRYIVKNLLISYSLWDFVSKIITYMSINKENNNYLSIKTWCDDEFRNYMSKNMVESILPRFFNHVNNLNNLNTQVYYGYPLDLSDIIDTVIYDEQTVICDDYN